MKIGISISSSLQAETPAQAAGWMIERAAAAHQAGLSSLSVGDHHAASHWYVQNTPILGRLLAEWPDRRAGCLFLLPLWSPVLVAEQVGTLAALLDAPFIIQTGVGGGARPFASFGADLTQRGRDTDEAIRVIQALLDGQEASSPRLGVGPTQVGLVPAQEVEWWIGGHAPAALERAARVGSAWYGGPDLDRDRSARLIDAYRQACDQAGTTPNPIVRRDVLVLPDGDRARRQAQGLVDRGYRGIDPGQLLIGSPDQVLPPLEGLSALGYAEVIVRTMPTGQDDALASIEQMGHLQTALEAAPA